VWEKEKKYIRGRLRKKWVTACLKREKKRYQIYGKFGQKNRAKEDLAATKKLSGVIKKQKGAVVW